MITYFETTISHASMQGDGTTKRVKEQLLVDAMSFTEAECRTIDYAESEGLLEFKVERERSTNYSEIIMIETDGDFYKVKVLYLTLDEKTGKQKRTASTVVVRASSPENAILNVNKAFANSVTEYIIDTVQLTNIKAIICTKK